MATITVEYPAIGQSITLDPLQTDLFMEEFRRTGRVSFWAWLSSLFARPAPRPSPSPHIAPELVVTVEDGGRRERYEVSGRYVLSKPGLREPRQFYFALLLFEWLDQASAPPP